MNFRFTAPILFLILYCPGVAGQKTADVPESFILSDNGGWCWFQGPRIVSDEEFVVIASVAIGDHDDNRRGNADAIVYHISTGNSFTSTLAKRLQANDHATPALLKRPDGRWLSVFTRHGDDNYMIYRISRNGNPGDWEEERKFIPSESTRITYSNLYMLEYENNRIFNFFRGLDNSWKPSFVFSDDFGSSWQTGNIFIEVPSEILHRPYVNYASNGRDKIHMVYTEGHPRDYNNSIYHIYYMNNRLYTSNASPIADLKHGLEQPNQGTLVQPGSPDSVHWTIDITLDSNEHPRILFSTKMNSTVTARGSGGDDHRYQYAYWDGNLWHVDEIAYAGTRLYAGEDEYTGLAAIDRNNPDVVYISTDADPVTGEPLISNLNGARHYEMFMGKRKNQGQPWEWTPLTQHSTSDNLRPITTALPDGRSFLAWLQGEYRTYTDYHQKVLGMILQLK